MVPGSRVSIWRDPRRSYLVVVGTGRSDIAFAGTVRLPSRGKRRRQSDSRPLFAAIQTTIIEILSYLTRKIWRTKQGVQRKIRWVLGHLCYI